MFLGSSSVDNYLQTSSVSDVTDLGVTALHPRVSRSQASEDHMTCDTGDLSVTERQ